MPPHINQFSVGTLYFQKEDGTLEPITEVKELDIPESETEVSRYPESIKPMTVESYVHGQIKIANGNWRQLYMNLLGITTRRKQKLVMRWYERLSKFNRKHNCGCDNRQILYFAIVKVSLGKNILYNYIFERKLTYDRNTERTNQKRFSDNGGSWSADVLCDG